MKVFFVMVPFFFCSVISPELFAQASPATGTSLYIDVHQLTPGKVSYDAVAQAHAKDLAVENKYNVQFLKYWVDEQKGLVYCLSSAADSSGIRKTHAEAHGLLPDHIYLVTDGIATALKDQKDLFLDVHYLGAGKVTAKDVAAAHQKDLAVQDKYGVNFINYWVDEKAGTVFCLSQAKDSSAIVNTHRLAHGLVPDAVMKVKQGE
jgi:hypothetical protein